MQEISVLRPHYPTSTFLKNPLFVQGLNRLEHSRKQTRPASDKRLYHTSQARNMSANIGRDIPMKSSWGVVKEMGQSLIHRPEDIVRRLIAVARRSLNSPIFTQIRVVSEPCDRAVFLCVSLIILNSAFDTQSIEAVCDLVAVFRPASNERSRDVNLAFHV